MSESKFNIPARRSRVLIAPLDWGLGHATRCIPIIKELVGNDCVVLVAAEKATQALLEKEFPQLTFIPLSGYRVKYSSQKFALLLKIILQTPRLFYCVYKEHQWLKKTVKTYKIDAVISDNRPGLYHSIVPSVYITHQLQIKTGNRLTEKIAQKLHYWLIKKYAVCWVPDFKGEENIGGELSHPQKTLQHIQYLGALSRFEKLNELEKIYHLIIIISGPEPQRTIFEKLLLHQLKEYDKRVLLVRGLPSANIKIQNHNSALTIVDHLSSEELNIAIQSSEYVISRSGYTTAMDLVKLGKKAIFVPTPGQTEQEYLAKYLQKKKMFIYKEQKRFSLQDVLKGAENFSYHIPNLNMDEYKNVIREFVEELKNEN